MDRVDAVSTVFCVVVIFILLIYFMGKSIEYKKELEQCNSEQKNELVDNQLIKINDSVYYRIHVRIDTTYYYANQESTKEATK